MATQWFQHVPDIGNSADKPICGNVLGMSWNCNEISHQESFVCEGTSATTPFQADTEASATG
jgi:hypothetical protein